VLQPIFSKGSSSQDLLEVCLHLQSNKKALCDTCSAWLRLEGTILLPWLSKIFSEILNLYSQTYHPSCLQVITTAVGMNVFGYLTEETLGNNETSSGFGSILQETAEKTFQLM